MTSSIDATKPEQGSDLVSAEIRNNFAAAKEEIEASEITQMLLLTLHITNLTHILRASRNV